MTPAADLFFSALPRAIAAMMSHVFLHPLKIEPALEHTHMLYIPFNILSPPMQICAHSIVELPSPGLLDTFAYVVWRPHLHPTSQLAPMCAFTLFFLLWQA